VAEATACDRAIAWAPRRRLSLTGAPFRKRRPRDGDAAWRLQSSPRGHELIAATTVPAARLNPSSIPNAPG
jgi:hypothetical protein